MKTPPLILPYIFTYGSRIVSASTENFRGQNKGREQRSSIQNNQQQMEKIIKMNDEQRYDVACKLRGIADRLSDDGYPAQADYIYELSRAIDND